MGCNGAPLCQPVGPAQLLRPRGLCRGCNDVCADARARCGRFGAGL